METTPSSPIQDTALSPDPYTDGAATGVQSAVRRAVRGAHAAVDAIGRKLESSVDRFKAGADSATESIEEGGARIAELERGALGAARSTVRDYPLLAVGVGIAAGVVLGRLLPR
ncbi:MAG: hypothetical protein ABI794_07370 [Betaproteobacteria bacterium]